MPAPAPAYSVMTEGLVALAAAATAKSILGAVAPAGKNFSICEVAVFFDGIDATQKPVLVEVCRSTQAGVGVNTAVTLRQLRGVSTYTGSTTGTKNYTTEPTVLTPLKRLLVDPYKGLGWQQFPLGREIECYPSGAIIVRMTIPTGGAAVNAEVGLEIEE